jgi:hypothetical protein
MLRRAAPLLLVAAVLLLPGAAAGQPFYGYNTVEGVCDNWTAVGSDGLGTDCINLAQYRPGVAALPNQGAAPDVQRPAVLRIPIYADGVQAKMQGNGSWSNPWKRYDTSVKWAAAQGSKVLFVALAGQGCTDTANCASLSRCMPAHTCTTWESYSYWVPTTSAELTRYRDWVKEIVQHYSGTGTLAQAVVGVEVWNEPNTEDPWEYVGGVPGSKADQTWSNGFVRGADRYVLTPASNGSGSADVAAIPPRAYADMACSALMGRKLAVDSGAARKAVYIGSMAWHIPAGSSAFYGSSFYSASNPAGSPGGPMGRWITDVIAYMQGAWSFPASSYCPAGIGSGQTNRFDAISAHAYPSPQATSILTGTQTGTNTCESPSVSNDTRANVNGCRIAEAFDGQYWMLHNSMSTAYGYADPLLWDEYGIRMTGTESSGLVLDAATQAAGTQYILRKCKAHGLASSGQVLGCYTWPIRSRSGSATSTIEGSGLWAQDLSDQNTAAKTAWLAALDDQRLNPSLYP